MSVQISAASAADTAIESADTTPARVEDTTPPKLVLVLVIDSLSAELLDRLGAEYQYKGGLRWIYGYGMRFRKTYHDHALTLTSPGHFTLMAGRHPGSAGVPANEFYDRTQKRIVYAVEDTQARLLTSDGRAASYRNIDATALGDWMKAANPKSQVFSIAGKDRAAVLMGGKRPDGAFWFDPQIGGFTTSTYYSDALPDLVRNFNAQKKPDRFFGMPWKLLLGKSKIYEIYGGFDDIPGENVLSDEEDSPVFPHVIFSEAGVKKPDADWYKKFMNFPWMDEVTLDLAKQILLSQKLGRDDAPDLLCVSLSAFDLINHTFGPASQEIIDALMRIDQEIGDLLKVIEKLVGLDQTLVVLSSDHGIQPLPELAHTVDALRAAPLARKFRERLQDEFREKYDKADELFLFRGLENITFDHDKLAARNIPRAEVYNVVRKAAEKETWVAFLFDRDQLESPKNLGPVGERLRHSFNPKRGGDIYLIPRAYYLTTGGRLGTSHGTPYDYDAQVPLIFAGFNVPKAAIDRPARTVDMAPTIARFLGVAVPNNVVGFPLQNRIRAKNRKTE